MQGTQGDELGWRLEASGGVCVPVCGDEDDDGDFLEDDEDFDDDYDDDDLLEEDEDLEGEGEMDDEEFEDDDDL